MRAPGEKLIVKPARNLADRQSLPLRKLNLSQACIGLQPNLPAAVTNYCDDFARCFRCPPQWAGDDSPYPGAAQPISAQTSSVTSFLGERRLIAASLASPLQVEGAGAMTDEPNHGFSCEWHRPSPCENSTPFAGGT